jgi:RNA polymerase sigma factor (TIGR02999 family)
LSDSSEAWKTSRAMDELHRLAHFYLQQEAPGHTLTPTALTNEAVLRAYGSAGDPKEVLRCKAQAAAMMRHILIDHARRKKAQKRGGGMDRVGLTHVDPQNPEQTIDVLELEDLLESLKGLCARQHEVVVLQFYGGLSQKEIADHLDVSLSTVEKDWRMARRWLRERLTNG